METSMCAYTLHLVSAPLRYPHERVSGVLPTEVHSRKVPL